MLDLRQHQEIVMGIQKQILIEPTYKQLNLLCGGARLILLDANEFIPDRNFKQLDAYRNFGQQVNRYVRYWCDKNRRTEGDSWDKLYWQTYLNGARARIFNDYLLFLERKREPRRMFYKPKIKQFQKFQLIESYQGMLDDRYDILCISMPPGSGKAQPLYSKVLTPTGFKQMGDLHVGDTVISGTGKESKVLGVFPQGKKKIYEITLDDGSKCRASDEHLWTVQKRNDTCNNWQVVNCCTHDILREPKCFFIPRTTDALKEVEYVEIDYIEYIGEEECQCIYIDDESHLYITDDYIITHNTTLLKFFHSAVIGWFPDDYSLFYSHSGDITRMYYDGVYQMVSDNLEYTWTEIFPDLKITSTNALMQQFNVGSYKPFPSLQTTSVGAKSAGKVRASKYLLTDDMIGSIEEALNKNYLDKMWNAYTVDAKQRKTVGSNDNLPCKEIMQATRWSTKDVIGRLIDQYQGNDRVKVISAPAIDPTTGESNFNYAVAGFTKEFYADIALTMDEISFKCLYLQQPVEREGLLFPAEKLQRYRDLPNLLREMTTGQCDTKASGTDYFVLPVLAKYGDLYYCIDCICSNSSDYEAQYQNAANILVDNKVEDCEFEGNNGGDRVALEVDKRVLDGGWICNITSRMTESNKEARIYQCSNWILQHVVFKDPSMYKPRDPYGIMMSLLMQYSTTGKKQLDDVPDVFSNFALRIQRRKPKPTRIIDSFY